MGTLLFFLTILLIVAALLVSLVSLIRRRMGTVRKVVLVLLFWLGAYAIALVAVSLTSQSQTLTQGQEHCFDEMCYSAKGSSQAKTLGNHSASGIFTVVDVQLRNAAKRSAQKPSNPQLWLVAPDGREYRDMTGGKGKSPASR